VETGTWLNVGLVIVFVLIGGVFAGTEFALVSLRESQISQLEKKGARGARVARVARDPNRFLAAVQIGVTVAGFLSAAYGASTLAPSLVPVLERLGVPETVAANLAVVLLTFVVAYLSLVLGELVPKRFALQRSSQVALAVGPALDRFATLVRPVVWLLSRSTDLVVRALGGDPDARGQEMSSEELRDVVLAHEGVPPDQRTLLRDVFASARTSMVEVMTPRTEVSFLAADMTLADAVEQVRGQPYSRYPVIGEDFDDLRGFVHVRDLFTPPLTAAGTAPLTVADVVRPVVAVPGTNELLPTLGAMRRDRVHLAVVVDEYGGTDGIVTLEDLVEELVGDIRDEYDPVVDTAAVGTYDAGLTIEEFARESGIGLPDGPYETVAGAVLARLGRLAVVGDAVEVDGVRLVVVEERGRRIRRVRVETLPTGSPVDGAQGSPVTPS